MPTPKKQIIWKDQPKVLRDIVQKKEALLGMAEKTPPLDGSLRVYWFPQVPCKPFHVEVGSLVEAARVMDALARYDEFQFMQHIKPDYSNAGGLEVYEGGEWVDWNGETEDGEWVTLADLSPGELEIYDQRRKAP